MTTKRFSPLFVVVVAFFITVLIVSNIIAVKLVTIGADVVVGGVSIFPIVLPAAMVVFPISYIIGDVLTEVYGYRQARLVIWLGFLCNLIAVGAIWAGGLFSPDPNSFGQEGEAAYSRILGYTPRLLGASFVAYLVGEFSNSFILSKMKVATKGKWLWSRTIGSTIVGEGLDSMIFISLAFGGQLPLAILVRIILTQWTAKVLYETAATPVTYKVVAFLKKRENVDAYDRSVNFNPLAVFDTSRT